MDVNGGEDNNEVEEYDTVDDANKDAEVMEPYYEEPVENAYLQNRRAHVIKKVCKRKKGNLMNKDPLVGSIALTMKGNRRGKSTLYIIGDHLYFNGTLQPNNVLRAKCRNFRTGSITCKACAYIEPETLQVLKFTGKHSCGNDPDLKFQIQMETEMKELAETTKDNLKDIYKMVCLKNPAIAQRIPYNRMCKSMDRRRREAQA